MIAKVYGQFRFTFGFGFEIWRRIDRDVRYALHFVGKSARAIDANAS